MSQTSFSSQSSKHHNSQTVRARDLKFWENVHPILCIICHMSLVTCHLSPVTYHIFIYLLLLFFIVTYFLYIFLLFVEGLLSTGIPRLVDEIWRKKHPLIVFWGFQKIELIVLVLITPHIFVMIFNNFSGFLEFF